MNIEQNVPLADILIEIGFIKIDHDFQFNFGNCKLTVQKLYGSNFNEIYLFTGFYRTKRTAGEIQFELPLKVESFEQGCALISYYLKGADLEIVPEWLKKGKVFQDHLPWIKARIAYDAIPKAMLEHEWFSIIVKKLTALVTASTEYNITKFTFDGEVLRIECNGNLLVSPAIGKPWNQVAILKTNTLKFLPKKIRKVNIELFIYDNMLRIGNREFPLEKKSNQI